MSLHRRRANQQKDAVASVAEARDSQGKYRDEPRRAEAGSVLRNAMLRYLTTVALAVAFWLTMQAIFKHAGHGLPAAAQ